MTLNLESKLCDNFIRETIACFLHKFDILFCYLLNEFMYCFTGFVLVPVLTF